MAEKSVAIRLGIVGGQEVTATFDQIGQKAGTAMQRVANETERASASVSRSTGQLRSQVQNASYQFQDIAVQIAGGTSATRALSQQLPQLLSAFGVWGAIGGTVLAVMIPLAAAVFNLGDKAAEAAKKVEALGKDVSALEAVNKNFTTDGVDQLIQKYGVLDQKVLLLIQHQREFALAKAMSDAKTAADGLRGGLDGVLAYLDMYDAFQHSAATGGGPEFLADAEMQAKALQEEYGLTIDQARALDDALKAVEGAQTFEQMADGAARLTALIQGTKLESSDFAGTLLAAEANLRQLNAEGSASHSWLGVAISLAGTWADKLWDAARGAAAARGAIAAKASPTAQLAAQYSLYGGAQTSMRGAQVNDSTLYGGNGDGLTADQLDTIRGVRRTGGGGGGGASSGAKKTNDLEAQAKQIYESTRTSAEKYAAELAKLEEIKKAGLIDGETYNRQVDALGEKYGQQVNTLKAIQKSLTDFATSAANSGKAIGDAVSGAFDRAASAVGEFVKTGKFDLKGFVADTLADFATIAARKYILGPLAGALSGALGGGALGGLLAGVVHEGGFAGGVGGRVVPGSAFIGARRYHSGGMVGDEVPAILLKRERVLNRDETKAYNAGLAAGGGGAPTVIFNVKDAQSVRQSRTQMAADAARIMAAARRAS